MKTMNCRLLILEKPFKLFECWKCWACFGRYVKISTTFIKCLENVNKLSFIYWIHSINYWEPFLYLFEQFLQHFVRFVIVVAEISTIYDDCHSNRADLANHSFVINTMKSFRFDRQNVLQSKVASFFFVFKYSTKFSIRVYLIA